MTLSDLKSSKSVWAAVILVVTAALFSIGYYFGSNKQVPVRIEEHTVVDTESKQKLEEQIAINEQLHRDIETAQQTISELKTHTKEKVRIIYQKDGTKIVEKEKETDTEQKVDDKKDTKTTEDKETKITDNKKVETDTKTHIDQTKITTVIPKDNYYLGFSGGVDPELFGHLGLEFKYRLFSIGKASIWLGAEAQTKVLQPKDSEVCGTLGLSF